MLNRFKNLKIVKKLSETSLNLKWLNFSQRKKTDADYINMICSDTNIASNSDEQRLEAMVREQLIAEFSPSIKNMQSYEYLVDAVMHNLKKKQLQAQDNDMDIAQ